MRPCPFINVSDVWECAWCVWMLLHVCECCPASPDVSAWVFVLTCFMCLLMWLHATAKPMEESPCKQKLYRYNVISQTAMPLIMKLDCNFALAYTIVPISVQMLPAFKIHILCGKLYDLRQFYIHTQCLWLHIVEDFIKQLFSIPQIFRNTWWDREKAVLLGEAWCQQKPLNCVDFYVVLKLVMYVDFTLVYWLFKSWILIQNTNQMLHNWV